MTGAGCRPTSKFRLEYLLAFRHVELPSPTCRSVLLHAPGTRQSREVRLWPAMS
jgi:hypothetical protein